MEKMGNSTNMLDEMLSSDETLVSVPAIIDDKPRPVPIPDIDPEKLQTDPSKYFIAPREPDKRKRKPNEERKTFEVNEMWEMHHEIVRRLLLGQKNREIAKSLSVSEQVVSYTRNSKVVRDKLDIMRAARDADSIDIATEIRDKAPKALKILESIIDDNGEKVAMTLVAKTAENWVNRAGYVAPKSVILEGIVAHFTADEIEKIKKDAIKDGMASGTIIDGEAEEVK